MTATVVRLLPTDEHELLKCYIDGTGEPDDADAFYDAIQVPKNATAPRLAIAVAQILLHGIQDSLPQWASVSNGRVSLNRKKQDRHKEARLTFSPQLICTINWADSGPGISWPEAYHITFLPGFDVFVITSSRDGPDAWGCSDHAIGVADGNLSPLDAAKKVITAFWRGQVNEWEQTRWAYLFAEGLIDTKIANAWAAEVWCPENSAWEEDGIYTPKIPMAPGQLPQQRINIVVELPARPSPFECKVGYDVVSETALPKRSTRSTKYLGQVEWAWSPVNSRIDAYYLEACRKTWRLWIRYGDDSFGKWQWQAVGTVHRKGVPEREAAVHLLKAFWELEANGEREIDRFHFINEQGLLSVEDLRAIARSVWKVRE